MKKVNSISALESAFARDNDYRKLKDISIIDYFNDRYYKPYFDTLREDFKISRMSELIGFDINKLFDKYKVLLNRTKHRISNSIIIYEQRLKYEGKYIFLSDVFKGQEFKPFVEKCYSSSVFDLRELDSFKLGLILDDFELLSSMEQLRDIILTKYYSLIEEHGLSVLKMNLKNLPNLIIFNKRYIDKLSYKDIGKALNFSKQRVNQQEISFFSFFKNYLSVIDRYIIEQVKKNNNIEQSSFVFGMEELKSMYKNLDDLLPEIIKIAIIKDYSRSIKYFSELDKFSVNINVLKASGNLRKLEINEFKNEFIDSGKVSFEDILYKYQLSFLSFDDLDYFLLNNNYSDYNWHNISWKRFNNYYIKGEITKKKVLSLIMHEFKEGIRIDNEGIETIRKKICKNFGFDILESSPNDGIKNAVIDNFFLIDRKTYIDGGNFKINKKLMERMKKYVDKMHLSTVVVHIEELYNKFKSSLQKDSNITNMFALYGVFQYHYADDYYYRKGIRRKETTGISFADIFEDYILNGTSRLNGSETNQAQFKRIVSNDDIKKDLNIKKVLLGNYLSLNKNILPWDKIGFYIHVNNVLKDIKDIDEFKWEIKKTINKAFEKNKNLLGTLPEYTNTMYVFYSNKRYFKDNKINNSYSLFSIIEYLFKDQFSFYRPHILKNKFDKKKQVFSIIFKHFTESKSGVFTFDEFKEFMEKISGKLTRENTKSLLSRFRNEFVEIDKEKYEIRLNRRN